MQMLEGKVVIVTGGGGNIGRVAAQVFSRHGARVLVTDLDRDTAEAAAETVRKAGGDAVAMAVDVTVESDAEKMVAFAVEHFGRLDGAFNNAGLAMGGAPSGDLERAAFDKTLSVDLIGAWHCMKYELKHFQTSGGGAIVNNASNAGKAGVPSLAPYGVAKAGLINLTKTASIEYATQAIRINAVCPGMIMSQEAQIAQAAQISEMLATFGLQIPMNRPGYPEEVSELAAWLLSPYAGYVTGQAISVDGGASAMQ